MNTEEGRWLEGIEEELCEHGMSAWLCMGPNHYPTMNDEMMGRYY